MAGRLPGLTVLCPEDPEAGLWDERRSERGSMVEKYVRAESGERERLPRSRVHRQSPQRARPTPAHLHHQHDGVQGDHGHDGVLEGRGHHEVPDAVLEGVPVLRHVARERLGADGEVDARPLQERHGRLPAPAPAPKPCLLVALGHTRLGGEDGIWGKTKKTKQNRAAHAGVQMATRMVYR